MDFNLTEPEALLENLCAAGRAAKVRVPRRDGYDIAPHMAECMEGCMALAFSDEERADFVCQAVDELVVFSGTSPGGPKKQLAFNWHREGAVFYIAAQVCEVLGRRGDFFKSALRAARGLTVFLTADEQRAHKPVLQILRLRKRSTDCSKDVVVRDYRAVSDRIERK